MLGRPAGDSDDSDDGFGDFSFGGDTKTFKERMAESRMENYRRRMDLNNRPENRIYNAIMNGNIESVTKELDGGTSVNLKLMEGYTPLLLAASHVNASIVQLLLDKDADITVHKDGLNALMAACNCNPYIGRSEQVVSVVKLLLERNIDVKMIDRKRRTALMFASAQGYPDVVQLLIPFSRLDMEDNQGWTALFHAVNSNHVEVTKILIEAGSNINHVDARMNNLHYYASINDQKEILELLPVLEQPLPTPDDLIDKSTPLEQLLDRWTPSRKDLFKDDVAMILYGAQCENLVTLFKENNVGLYEFLAMNAQDLSDLGVKLTFQRERITNALYRFHKYAFKNKSMPSVCTDKDYSTYDILVTIANSIKHLTIMEASLTYLRKNLPEELNEEKLKYLSHQTKALSSRVHAINYMTQVLEKIAIKLDAVVPYQPDLITKETKFRKYSFKFSAFKFFTALTLTSVSLLLCIRLR